MREFLHRIIIFLSVPFSILVLLFLFFLIKDPFNIVKPYKPNKQEDAYLIPVNKAYQNVKRLSYYSNFINYNAFILGNSRAIFYEVEDWKKYIGDTNNCFHFETHAENLFGLERKINYLDRQNYDLDHILIILDPTLLNGVKPKEECMFTVPPQIVENQNLWDFYYDFFKYFISSKFLFAYIDYTLNGKIRDYMLDLNIFNKTPFIHDEETNQERFAISEREIAEGVFYNEERMKVFYSRSGVEEFSEPVIKEKNIELLKSIKRVLDKRQTKYKIIVSPLYSQIRIAQEDLKVLKGLFGENVYDFTGINEFTEDYRNYYESSHYRPVVSREILKRVYTQ